MVGIMPVVFGVARLHEGSRQVTNHNAAANVQSSQGENEPREAQPTRFGTNEALSKQGGAFELIRPELER